MWITSVAAVAIGLGLFQASVVLRLRAIHGPGQEALGWVSLGFALLLLLTPSLLSRRTLPRKPIGPGWAWLLIMASLPVGYAVIHISAPSWLNADVMGGVLALALASAALALAVSGLLASRSLGGAGLKAGYGVAVVVAAATVGSIAWVILFFE